ncbi:MULTISPECIES: SDR family oxidoreductase [Paraburkholderia]|uniref:SDR family oxidoreductase n=1 Tax=Paraburkholderia TaxID=1822464 RepID=UPI0038B97326
MTSFLNPFGRDGQSLLSASKAAVRSLARTYSCELLERGFRVNAISPAAIDTPLHARVAAQMNRCRPGRLNLLRRYRCVVSVMSMKSLAQCSVSRATTHTRYREQNWPPADDTSSTTCESAF